MSTPPLNQQAAVSRTRGGVPETRIDATGVFEGESWRCAIEIQHPYVTRLRSSVHHSMARMSGCNMDGSPAGAYALSKVVRHCAPFMEALDYQYAIFRNLWDGVNLDSGPPYELPGAPCLFLNDEQVLFETGDDDWDSGRIVGDGVYVPGDDQWLYKLLPDVTGEFLHDVPERSLRLHGMARHYTTGRGSRLIDPEILNITDLDYTP